MGGWVSLRVEEVWASEFAHFTRASYRECACCYASKPWERDASPQFRCRRLGPHPRRVSESSTLIFQQVQAFCPFAPAWTLFWTVSWTPFLLHSGSKRPPGPPECSASHRRRTSTAAPASQPRAPAPPPEGTQSGSCSRPRTEAAEDGAGGGAKPSRGRHRRRRPRPHRSPCGESCGGSCRLHISARRGNPPSLPPGTRRSRRARGRRCRRRGSSDTPCSAPSLRLRWCCFSPAAPPWLPPDRPEPSSVRGRKLRHPYTAPPLGPLDLRIPFGEIGENLKLVTTMNDKWWENLKGGLSVLFSQCFSLFVLCSRRAFFVQRCIPSYTFAVLCFRRTRQLEHNIQKSLSLSLTRSLFVSRSSPSTGCSGHSVICSVFAFHRLHMNVCKRLTAEKFSLGVTVVLSLLLGTVRPGQMTKRINFTSTIYLFLMQIFMIENNHTGTLCQVCIRLLFFCLDLFLWTLRIFFVSFS